MKSRAPRAPLYKCCTAVVAVLLATAAIWTLAQPSAPVVKADTTLGGPLPNLTPKEMTLFTSGEIPFAKLWGAVQGIGPVFTQTGCTGCHSDPVTGGNSTRRNIFVGKLNGDGSYNPLVEEGGPMIQPNSVSRFKANCNLSGEVVPPDATIVAKHVGPPAFGMGLIDSIPDSAILANAFDHGDGVNGIANMVLDEMGNTRVGKYGYKSQIATVMQMTGDAMTHEIGITNPVEPNEDPPQGKSIPVNCSIHTEPNDNGVQMVATYNFLMYLAPNTPGPPDTTGRDLFTSVGCAECHVPTFTTGDHIPVITVWGPPRQKIFSKALSLQPVNLYSDLLIHDMGTTLADGITMGMADGTHFRTTALWGLSTRKAYLHDGRTTSLNAAILAHGGEAVNIINNYKGLSHDDQLHLIAFINSL